MNNEIGRKITSLTLMTIMVAGGLTFAFPGVMPAAHAANANLFVSAENSQFDNYMSGPQVIEVVVIDNDIDDTDEAKGEPDVTVNGKILRMVQAVDGNWYGYFADRTQASIADHTANAGAVGHGLDFGTFCSSSTQWAGASVSFTDTVGVAFPATISTGVNGDATGSAITASCASGTATNNGTAMQVLREAKGENAGSSTVGVGQIGLNSTSSAIWPFIQLYQLNPTGNVIVQYNKGGGVQSTTLTFDTVDQFAGASLDRTVYTRDAQVHVTVTDLWLNIDPTDEDSWTFGTNSSYVAANVNAADDDGVSVNYQVFDENGAEDGAGTPNGIKNIKGNQTSMMIEDNGVLILDVDAQNSGTNVLTLQDNDDTVITCGTAQDASTCITSATATGLGENTQPITITEQGPNTGVFGTYDESDVSVIKMTSTAKRGTSATIDYNETPVTILTGFAFGTIDIQAADDEWNSGEEIPVILVDADANKNSRADEDLDLNDPNVSLIPSLRTGDPFTLGEGTNATQIRYASVNATSFGGSVLTANIVHTTSNVTSFSKIAKVQAQGGNPTAVGSLNFAPANSLVIDYQTTMADLRNTVGNTNDTAATADRLKGFNFLNLDVRSFNNTGTFSVYLLNSTTDIINGAGVTGAVGFALLTSTASPQSLINLNGSSNTVAGIDFYRANAPDANNVGLLIQHNSDTTNVVAATDAADPIVADFFSFGFKKDGILAGTRIANQIIRIEAEETGDNTSTFEGSLEYIMVNQLNILDLTTYTSLTPIADDPNFIVIEDLTDEDAPRVNYLDLGADGVSTQIADQEEAPSHSGVVSFDSNTYKTADTVTITLEDLDLNVDSDLIDIYTTVTNIGDQNQDAVGSGNNTSGGTSVTLSNGDELGRLLDVTFDDIRWQTPQGACLNTLTGAAATDSGLGATGFTLVETGPSTGIFLGDFQIPNAWCRAQTGSAETTTGLDIEVNYVDFRDASGELIEVGDSAGVRANTGSVSLDRTVYPVPFGVESDFTADATEESPNGRALFPIHASGMNTAGTSRSGEGLQTGEFLADGDLTIHVRVNDPDFDVSASGEDTIAQNSTAGVGPVKISVIRGSSSVILGHAGGDAVLAGTIDTDGTNVKETRQFGPIDEIAPDAGIFEIDVTLRYTDGPASTTCPSTTDTWTNLDGAGTAETDRFDVAATSGDYCILQGDILQVEYTDPADASGDVNTVTDSATFDLRNGVLQSDKSVYIIGSDMILTLIEPDFDLDNDQAETYDLDLIEWDSDAATVTMGDADGEGATFDPEPLNFRETGDSTGIFQIVIEIPEELAGDRLERGEEIVLEYTDWGPSGADYVGNEDEDVNLTIFTSNFGATVELDQKVYTWTDKVYITIVAPDHNFDSDLVDEIGNTDLDPIKVATRGADLDKYKLVETGTDTGIFTGEVILTGFTHDADGDSTTGTNGNDVVTTSSTGSGPTDGLLSADDDDGLTVSFEFSEDETVVGSALIRWNIGEVQWLEASYPASGTGVVRVIDPDMNLDPEAVDNFDVDVWSDSDAGGIDLTVTETNEATGIYEGTVFFTTTDESSGHRLRVAEGDTVTAEYEDNTLPDPYTTADELDITATSLIGTVVPPLERAPAANLRTVDAFGNSLDTVSVDQQVQISADLANGQDREQAFAYLVQIQDGNGVTVSLAWITGSLSSGQSFSPALSWIPTQSGSYTATAFVWESVDNPTALSPPVSTTITVQ
ncbi:beta strand repeat-containing protein [Nitrosopumilus adriaticus]|uniref:beta strand repeat-containing protein n=1 Tax=Nitrosopumilus adriaticus TaxID=1580092 RepID=UPI00352EB6F7